MAKLTMEINMDNAAFEDCNGTEVARMLRDMAQTMDGCDLLREHGLLFDINGNKVGFWKVA